MNILAILSSTFALAASPADAFVSGSSSNHPSTSLRAEIGETGISFENVAREWRCKVCRFYFYDARRREDK